LLLPTFGFTRFFFFFLLPPGVGDALREGDAGFAVVNAEEAAAPGGGAEGEEEGAVAAAEVEEGGCGFVEGRGLGGVGGRRRRGGGGGGEFVKEVEELGFGVRVVEPDGAFLAWVGGVVGQLGRVGGVPAIICQSMAWVGGGRDGVLVTIALSQARRDPGGLAWRGCRQPWRGVSWSCCPG